jgi:hypothetical protein
MFSSQTNSTTRSAQSGTSTASYPAGYNPAREGQSNEETYQSDESDLTETYSHSDEYDGSDLEPEKSLLVKLKVPYSTTSLIRGHKPPTSDETSRGVVKLPVSISEAMWQTGDICTSGKFESSSPVAFL